MTNLRIQTVTGLLDQCREDIGIGNQTGANDTLAAIETELALLSEEMEMETGSEVVRAGPHATGGGGAVVPLLDAQAAQTYRDGFNATEGRWNAKEGKHDTVPDMKTRLETLKSYMAYRHGMPLQRQLVIERSLKDRETELKEVAATPSGRTLLLKLGAISPEWLEKHLPGKVLESQ